MSVFGITKFRFDRLCLELVEYFFQRYGGSVQVLRSASPARVLSHVMEDPPTDHSSDDKEPVMNPTPAPLFETRTYINGVDASTMSDEQIFDAIRQLENTVDDLSKIKNKPKKLKAKIEDLTAGIAKLSEYVDNR